MRPVTARRGADSTGQNAIRRWLEILRSEGLLRLGWRAIVKLLSPLGEIDVATLLEKDLTEAPARAPARVSIDIGEASVADIEPLLTLRMGPPPAVDSDPSLERGPSARRAQHLAFALANRAYRAALLADNFARGDRCFAARVGDEIVHCNWLCFDWGSAVPGYLALAGPGEVYTTGCYTAEAWRGKGIHNAVKAEMLRFARTAGCHNTFTLTRTATWRATNALLRLGYRRRGRLLFFNSRAMRVMVLLRLGGRIDSLVRLR